MREILFRAKTIDTESKWVEGFYVHVPNGRFLCDEHMIQTIAEDGRIGQLYDVYESTVGQFTGLVDKDGRKIFEGDIIKIRFEGDSLDGFQPPAWYDIAKVVYSSEHHGWYAVYADGDELSMWEYDDNDDVVIVGNIHDTPKLFGGLSYGE